MVLDSSRDNSRLANSPRYLSLIDDRANDGCAECEADAPSLLVGWNQDRRAAQFWNPSPRAWKEIIGGDFTEVYERVVLRL
jgi:hypothetical protein